MRTMIRKAKAGFTLIELMIVVAIVGVLAVLAIFGVRKYISNAKTAEAKNSIGQISKDAVSALEREKMDTGTLGLGGTAALGRSLCADSTRVPSTLTNIKGKKYQPDSTKGKDYNTGDQKIGWRCLNFEMTSPQYYAYKYTAKGAVPADVAANDTVVIDALGDLNGDGTFSTFSLAGTVSPELQLRFAPSILEVDPEE